MNTVKLQLLENAMFIKVGFQLWPPVDKKHFTNDRQGIADHVIQGTTGSEIHHRHIG